MNSFLTVVSWIGHNWAMVIVVVILISVISDKIKKFQKLPKDKKLQAILDNIKETILTYVYNAEINWEDYIKSGVFKRAEVINKIYEKYPELQEYVNQEEIINIIDNLIDSALVEVNSLIKKDE